MVDLQCCVFQVYNKVSQLYVYIYPHCFRFFSHIDPEYQVESLVLDSKFLLVIYHIVVCICQSQSFNLSLLTSLTPGNHKFIFYILDSTSVL